MDIKVSNHIENISPGANEIYDLRDEIDIILKQFADLKSEIFKPTLQFLPESKFQKLFKHLKLVLYKSISNQFDQQFPVLIDNGKLLEELIKKNTAPQEQIQWRPNENPREYMRSSFIKAKERYLSELTILIQNKRESVQQMKETLIKQRQKYEEINEKINEMSQITNNNHQSYFKLLFFLNKVYKNNITLH